MFDRTKLLVYLGAGSDRIDGFTHLDNNITKQFKKGNDVGPPEILADLRDKFIFSNSSVDLFYSIHTFEHLTYWELIDCLLECKRSLKLGGTIRIVVPCFDCMINDYKNNVPVASNFWELDENLPITSPTELFIARVLYHDHRYLHNFDTLKRILKKTGFSKIRVCSPGETRLNYLQWVFSSKEAHRGGGDVIVEASNLGDMTDIEKPLRPQPKIFYDLRIKIEDFLNLKISRKRRLLPTFPEKFWFRSLAKKTKRINLKYYNSSSDL